MNAVITPVSSHTGPHLVHHEALVDPIFFRRLLNLSLEFIEKRIVDEIRGPECRVARERPWRLGCNLQNVLVQFRIVLVGNVQTFVEYSTGKQLHKFFL